MNGMDDKWNVSAAVIDALIEEVYEEYVSVHLLPSHDIQP